MLKGIGVYNSAQLRERGVSRVMLEQMLQDGRLRRIARGWYATCGADERVVAAVKVGGRVGCLTVCELYGLWVPPGSSGRLHMTRGRGQRLVGKLGAVEHTVSKLSANAVVTVEEALRQVLRFHDAETALVVLESAVNKGAITCSCALEMIVALPGRKRAEMQFFTAGAQSGSETRVRLFLQRRHVPVKIQQWISGTGRVDLLAGRSWIIECDSRAHHTGDEHYHGDRVRDLNSEVMGFHTTRLSYAQIWYQWEETQKMLSGVLKTRRHRLKPKPVVHRTA